MVPRLVPEILSKCVFCDEVAVAVAVAGIGDSRSLIDMPMMMMMMAVVTVMMTMIKMMMTMIKSAYSNLSPHEREVNVVDAHDDDSYLLDPSSKRSYGG